MPVRKIGISKILGKGYLALLIKFSLFLFVFNFLFADFIANEKPIYCNIQGKSYFPVLKSYSIKLGLSKWDAQFMNIEWRKIKYNAVIWTPIPYSPKNLDLKNANFKSPFKKQNVKNIYFHHFLGTGSLGEDVFSVLIHGTRYAFLVGLGSTFIALSIGLLLGGISGFVGDKNSKISISGIIAIILALFSSWYYGLYLRRFNLQDSFSMGFVYIILEIFKSLMFYLWIFLFFYLCHLFIFKKIPILSKKIFFPIDLFINRAIEIFISLPKLMILLIFMAFLKPSIFNVVFIIGILSWPSFAIFIRAELLKIREAGFIKSIRMAGASELRIFFKHALPNALPPIWIVVAFAISGAVLTESSLSFLGLGSPPEILSWGKLLAQYRENPTAWWILLFPGALIFWMIFCFNFIGLQATKYFNPKRSI